MIGIRRIRCQKCKQVYEYVGLPPKCCPDCSSVEKEISTLVRNYVRTNRGANVMEISEQTGISVTKLLQYIRDGTLETIDKNY